MSRAKKVCSTPGCPNLRPCSVEGHEPKAWQGSTRGGSDKGWRKTRARILRRDPVCVVCGVNPSTVCDHILARAFGGVDNDANLQGICEPCNCRKSAAEGVMARQRVGGDH